jgi:RHS repeat-associated protein
VITYSNYDSYGFLCWQSIPGASVSPTAPCSTPPAQATSYNYNEGDELLSESTPDGSGSSYTYDTTTYTYNAYGQIQTEVSPDGNVAGGDPANYTTTYYYNAADQLHEVVAPMGRTTIAVLDADGNVDSVTDPAGNVTSTAYDQDNRTCWVYQGSATSTCGSPPAGSAVYGYDANTDNPDVIGDPNNHLSYYTYGDQSAPNDPTQIVDGLDNITTNVYDADGYECLTGTASTALPSGEQNCNDGWEAGYTFDTFDQLGNVTSTTDPNDNTTTYVRYQPGQDTAPYPSNVYEVVPPSTSEADITYTYGADGRVNTEETGSSSDAITTTYTPTGQPCWQAPVYEPGATCSSTVPTAVGTSLWAYYYSQLPSAMVTVQNSGDQSAYYAYDANGNETTDYSNSKYVQYSYDTAGDNVCVAYPVSSALSSCSLPAGPTNSIVNYGYNADGRMTSMSDWLGNSFTFGYTSPYSPADLTSIDYPAASTWDESSVYDPDNNLKTWAISSPTYGTAVTSNTFNADEEYKTQGSLDLGYNPQSQVTTDGSDSFVNQPNGEIAKETVGSEEPINYTYNVNSQVTSIDNTNSGVEAYYNYNAAGDRCVSVVATSAPPSGCGSPPSGAVTTNYNNFNQLCTVAVGSALVCSSSGSGLDTFSYDGNGLRTSDDIEGTSQNFFYDSQTRPGQPLIIEDGTNAYLYGPANFGAGTAPLEQISLSSGTASYLFSSPTGVYAMSSANGDPDSSDTYSPYGVRTQAGSASTPFGFEGAYTDPTGYVYLIGRYYDPTTGQFLSVDPLVGETGQPYAYTKDDPVNATDPLGDIPYVPTPGGEIVGGSLLVDAQEATKTAAATPKSGGSTTPSVPISGTPATVPIFSTPTVNVTATLNATVTGPNPVTPSFNADGVYSTVNLSTKVGPVTVNGSIGVEGPTLSSLSDGVFSLGPNGFSVSTPSTSIPLGPDDTITSNVTVTISPNYTGLEWTAGGVSAFGLTLYFLLRGGACVGSADPDFTAELAPLCGA